ncbi:MAG: S8 family serine peptidase [Tunicatimonas sp.]
MVKILFYFFGISFLSYASLSAAYGQADGDTVPNRILVKVDASLKAEFVTYVAAQNPRLLSGGMPPSGVPSRSGMTSGVPPSGVPPSGVPPNDRQQLAQLNQRYGVRTVRRVFPASARFEAAHRRFGLHRWYEVAFDDTLSTEVQQVLAHYRANPLVTLAEPVYLHVLQSSTTTRAEGDPVVTDDPRFAEQWHYYNTGQSGGTVAADIQLTTAWSVTRGDARVVVAIIDGGIDTEHEDLREALWVNEAEQNGQPNVDDDGNGYVDDVHGYGFGDRRGQIAPSRHGTHVAGVIGAISDNGVGVAGVAGGSGSADGVRLMSCAVFGAGSQGGFAEAFVYAADHGAVIAQNSWGGGDQSVLLEDAIRYFTERAGLDNRDGRFEQNQQIGPMAGGLVVFAAGNDKTDNVRQAYPASLPDVLAVASTDHDDHRSDFSNYGNWVDLAAPGTDVLSTYPGNDYKTLSGTSMAAPQVSGAAALLVGHYQQPGLSPNHLRTLLLSGADPIDDRNPHYAGRLGRGRLNAYRALTQDQAEPPGPVTALTAQTQAHDQIRLQWIASGADGDRGTAAYYELRYATAPITAQNFNQATLVPTKRSPRPSGTVDTVLITGLRATTPYYFALRTRDLLGQVSPVSETVSATTLAPPAIAVRPATLAVTLNVGQTRRDTVTVANTTGLSTLAFTTATARSEGWLDIADHSGAIAAGEQELLVITTDARRLAEGIYYDTLLISSNDPVAPQISVPVRATVVGVPQLVVSSSSIFLEDVWESTPRHVALTLRNGGTGTLRISRLEASGPGFTVDTSSLTLAPGARHAVTISFSPTALGTVTGTLTLLSNDAQQPRLDIPLSARVIPTPPLALPSRRLALTVTRGDTLRYPIQLRSLSTDTLAWTLSAEAAPAGWILTPEAGQLAPGDVISLLLTVDATALAVGTYQPTIAVRSESDTAVMSVNLVVEEAIAPLAFAYDLPEQRLLLIDTTYQLDIATYVGQVPTGSRFTAVTEDTTLLQVKMDSSRLLLRPQRAGVTTVSVALQGTSSPASSTSFRVVIVPPNRVPEASDSLDALLLVDPDTRTLVLSELFSDPDQDSLTYVAESSDPAVVAISLEGETLTVRALRVGRAEVMVQATDPYGARAALTLAVEVTAVTATTDQHTPTLSLVGYPNPADDWLTVRYTLARSGPVHLVLLDEHGRPLYTWEAPSQAAGSYTLPYQTTGLPAGIYVLRLFSRSETVTRKIMVR